MQTAKLTVAVTRSRTSSITRIFRNSFRRQLRDGETRGQHSRPVGWERCINGGRLPESTDKLGLGGKVGSASTRQRLCSLTMRKQKASDKRTSRLQRGAESGVVDASDIIRSLRNTLTTSPMADAMWVEKEITSQLPVKQTGGRGRSRKRSSLYHCLSNYHEQFLTLLTAEYKAEVRLLSFS